MRLENGITSVGAALSQSLHASSSGAFLHSIFISSARNDVSNPNPRDKLILPTVLSSPPTDQCPPPSPPSPRQSATPRLDDPEALSFFQFFFFVAADFARALQIRLARPGMFPIHVISALPFPYHPGGRNSREPNATNQIPSLFWSLFPSALLPQRGLNFPEPSKNANPLTNPSERPRFFLVPLVYLSDLPITASSFFLPVNISSFVE